MSDVIIESIRAVLLLCLFCYLVRMGKSRREICTDGWSFVIIGFGLLLLGSLVDITDNFESLNRFIVVGDTPAQAFLEKMVGFMGGFGLLAIGLIRWIPTITGVEHDRQTNKQLEKEITKRKEMEAELKEKQERLGLAMHAAEHGFWDWNMDTDKVYFSSRYCTMLGYEPDELPMVLDTWINLLHPEDRESTVSKVQQHVEKVEPFKVQFRMKCKDGSWKWISGRGKSYDVTDDGKPNRAVGIHVDITERKQAEEEKTKTMAEMERMNRLMAGREMRVIEIKREVNALLAELGREPQYQSVLEGQEVECSSDKTG